MSPYILNQIILQLHMSFPITHVFMKFDELFKRCRYSMLRHNILTLKLKALIVQTFRALVFYDHIVHDHTSSHHLPQFLRALSISRIPMDAPSRLQNTKGTLDILSSTLLLLGKSFPFLFDRVGYCLDNSGPLRIDTVTQIVPFVVVVAVDSKVHRWVVDFDKPSKHRRALKHVHIIV